MDGIIIDCAPQSSPVFEEFEDSEEKNLSSEEQITVRRRAIRKINFSDEKLEELNRLYSFSCVSDFEDTYHKSEEEKKEENEFYDLFKDYNTKRKAKTRKLDEYVYQCRYMMKLLEGVANRNGVYDPDEFKRLVLKGKIKVHGIDFPRFNGSKKIKKSINWDYVSDMILDTSLDPSILVKKKEIVDEDIEKTMSPEELNKLYNKLVSDEDMNIMKDHNYISRPNLEVQSISKSDLKALYKNTNYHSIMNNVKREELRGQRVINAARELINDDMEYIIENDERLRSSTSIIPEFNGDINNQDDVDLYMLQLEDYDDEHDYVDYHGRLIKKSDYNEIEFKEILDEAGWDLKKVFNYESERKELRRQAKKDAKRRKILKDRIKALDDRKALREGKYTTSIIKDKKKKKKTKKKNKQRMAVVKGTMLDAVGSKHDSWKDYRYDMENMTL